MKYTIPVLSALFLVYGVVYSMVYYGMFGISVQYYFGIEDYVRANLNNLASFLVPVVVGPVLGVVTDRRGPPANESARRERELRDDNEAGLFAIFVLVSTILIADKLGPYALGGVAGVIGLAWLRFSWRVLPQWLMGYLRSRSVALTLALVDIVPLTIGWNVANAVARATAVRTEAMSRHVSVQFTDEASDMVAAVDPDSLVMIGMTSNYCFLYERGASCTHIVPTRFIKHIGVGPRVARPTAKSP